MQPTGHCLTHHYPSLFLLLHSASCEVCFTGLSSIIECHSYELIIYIAFHISCCFLSHLCFTTPLKDGWRRNVMRVGTENILKPCNSRQNPTLTLTTYFHCLLAVLPSSSTLIPLLPILHQGIKGLFQKFKSYHDTPSPNPPQWAHVTDTGQ